MSPGTDVTVDDILRLADVGGLPLVRPVMVIALTGWFDIAKTATNAADLLTPDEAVTVAEIEPDPFYDFTQQRPMIRRCGDHDDIEWPGNEFRVTRTGSVHDLVVLSGVEPHLYWRTYTEVITTVVRRLGCELVVTLGASPDAVPHTRPPIVVGSSATPGLARQLGLQGPTYQGITGVVGVVHAALESEGIPTISLRVGVPHYLGTVEHPAATAALLDHLMHVLGLPLTFDLDVAHECAGGAHEGAVNADEQLQLYVRMLEVEYDRRAEAAIPDRDELSRALDDFLQHPASSDPGDRHDGDPDPPGGAGSTTPT